MRFCYLGMMLFWALNSFSQAKVYIDKKGNNINNAKKAVAYKVVIKMSDSSYVATTYNMRDTITSKYCYKDSTLQVLHGKFIIYTKNTIPEEMRGILHNDTNSFISLEGEYLNGGKTGTWTEYISNGIKQCSYVYKNNKRNGLFKIYDVKVNNYVLQEGGYVDGKKEGEWNTYGYDTLKTPVVSWIFKDDKLLKKIDHIKIAAVSTYLTDYLSNKLHPKNDSLLLRLIETKITIDTSGNVKNPVILTNVSPGIHAFIIKILIDAPKFKPELHDNKPVEMTYDFNFLLGKNGPGFSGFNRVVISLLRDAGKGIKMGWAQEPKLSLLPPDQ